MTVLALQQLALVFYRRGVNDYDNPSAERTGA